MILCENRNKGEGPCVRIVIRTAPHKDVKARLTWTLRECTPEQVSAMIRRAVEAEVQQ
jgi:hypothetical protein